MALDCAAVSSPPAGSMAAAGADVNRPATSPAAPAITRPALKALSRLRRIEQRVIPQLQGLERLARQRAALQDVVLRLVVVGLGLSSSMTSLKETTFGFSASISSRVRASKIGVAVKV